MCAECFKQSNLIVILHILQNNYINKIKIGINNVYCYIQKMSTELQKIYLYSYLLLFVK
jgi:hypothetical protein